MSPSSSRSDANPFDFLVATGPVAEATSTQAWLTAMLEVEAALAWSQADAGVIPAAAAHDIAAACDVGRIDVARVLAGAADGGNLLIPLLVELRSLAGDAGHLVHRGATSQDIVDTAAMVIVRRCGERATAMLDAAGQRVAEVEEADGATPMIGRTLLQHAEPTTFATVTGAWAAGLAAGAERLRALAPRLPVQLGGPVGDRVTLGPGADAIAGSMAARLGLRAAPAWPAQRTLIAEIAGAWGLVAGAAGAIATDVVVLASSDVGELREDAEGAGGSSSMPHKRNPIAAISARAAAMQAPGLVATLLHAAGHQELQRAAGAWHAEGPALHGLLRVTGSALEWLVRSLDRLVVDPERMVRNMRRAEEAR